VECARQLTHVPDHAHCDSLKMLQVHELGMRGIRSLAVARTDDEGRWRMLGILTFLDPPRRGTGCHVSEYCTAVFGIAVSQHAHPAL
jgi:hypothetical protein